MRKVICLVGLVVVTIVTLVFLDEMSWRWRV